MAYKVQSNLRANYVRPTDTGRAKERPTGARTATYKIKPYPGNPVQSNHTSRHIADILAHRRLKMVNCSVSATCPIGFNAWPPPPVDVDSSTQSIGSLFPNRCSVKKARSLNCSQS